mmetsp:Transcript_3983/g.9396  ORF Transcript_3983/g.9396 Transcript_3983/m.9396 type:complete len:422 (+) Transcript_3983:125-1390(+)
MQREAEDRTKKSTSPAGKPPERAASPLHICTWYPRLKQHALKTELVQLSDAFLRYLKEDGVRMPAELTSDVDDDEWWSDDEDEDERRKGTKDAGEITPNNGDGGGEKNAEKDKTSPSSRGLSETLQGISKVLDTMGPKTGIFPKLNDVAPTDAKWVMCDRTLRCRTVKDVLLLLKSSTRIGDALDDLEETEETSRSDSKQEPTEGKRRANPIPGLRAAGEAFNSGSEEPRKGDQKRSQSSKRDTNYLVLKKYSNLHPSREFRCFVRGSRLSCACQRSDVFHEHLDSEVPNLKPQISKFFKDTLIPNVDCEDFVADVYIDRRQRVFVLDLHPYGSRDPLLFTEGYDKPPLSVSPGKDTIEFRVMVEEKQTRPSFYTYDRLPQEKLMFDLTSAKGIENMIDAARQGKLGEVTGQDSDTDGEDN